MQRHRNQCVGLAEKFVPSPTDPVAHHWCKVKPVAIFECVHQRARNLVETHRCASAIIGRRVGNRLHRQDARSGVIDEGRAQPLAIGSRNERQFGPACRTQPAALDRLTARRTKWRQREIEHAPQHRMGDAAGTLERSRENIAGGQH